VCDFGRYQVTGSAVMVYDHACKIGILTCLRFVKKRI
jgi:hypothetical protein